VLNDKESAVGVTASNLEKERGAETQGMGLAKSVVASADDVKFARGGRCGGLRFHLTCATFKLSHLIAADFYFPASDSGPAVKVEFANGQSCGVARSNGRRARSQVKVPVSRISETRI